MENRQKYLLAGCYQHEGKDKDTGNPFQYVKLHLTNLDKGYVISPKLADTPHFINSVLPRASQLIGKMVYVVFEERNYSDDVRYVVTDILSTEDVD